MGVVHHNIHNNNLVRIFMLFIQFIPEHVKNECDFGFGDLKLGGA